MTGIESFFAALGSAATGTTAATAGTTAVGTATAAGGLTAAQIATLTPIGTGLAGTATSTGLASGIALAPAATGAAGAAGATAAGATLVDKVVDSAVLGGASALLAPKPHIPGFTPAPTRNTARDAVEARDRLKRRPPSSILTSLLGDPTPPQVSAKKLLGA